ncbi:MAG: hypothetical protein ACK6DB_05450, partial [Planctomycetota bacterium]
VEHRSHPTFGWHFHPESFLSVSCVELIMRFLRRAGLEPTSCPDVAGKPRGIVCDRGGDR